MVCEGCRSHARTLIRAAARASAPRLSTKTTTSFFPPTSAHTTSSPRYFGNTSSRRLLKGLGSAIVEPYRVLAATEQLFKVSSVAADYQITEKQRKDGAVTVAHDGEELGDSLDPKNVWHSSE